MSRIGREEGTATVTSSFPNRDMPIGGVASRQEFGIFGSRRVMMVMSLFVVFRPSRTALYSRIFPLSTVVDDDDEEEDEKEPKTGI